DRTLVSETTHMFLAGDYVGKKILEFSGPVQSDRDTDWIESSAVGSLISPPALPSDCVGPECHVFAQAEEGACCWLKVLEVAAYLAGFVATSIGTAMACLSAIVTTGPMAPAVLAGCLGLVG